MPLELVTLGRLDATVALLTRVRSLGKQAGSFFQLPAPRNGSTTELVL